MSYGLRCSVVVFLWAACISTFAAKLTALDSAIVGSQLEVTWEGPANGRYYVTIVTPDAPASTYTQYQYTSEGNPISLRAPGTPGVYELRLVDESAGKVLASRPIEIKDAKVTLSSPPSAKIGETIDIHWQGPGNKGDYITVVPKGAPEGSYTAYQYLSDAKVVSLRMPEESGEYEIRYTNEYSYRTFAQNPIAIDATSASVGAPNSAQAGSSISITWSGPNNEGDFLTIVPKGSDEGVWQNFAYTKKGNPLILNLPDAAGDYEIRYATGKAYKTLARQTITLLKTSATVDAPKSVQTLEKFAVNWAGPNNELDFITLVRVDAKEGEWDIFAHTKRGNPVYLKAPKSPGDYEVRYSSGQSYTTLAKTPIKVTQGKHAGYLQVKASPEWLKQSASEDKNIIIILDASGSMLKQEKGRRRIDDAKTALIKLTEQLHPEKTYFSLRVFGHKEVDSCRTDLEIPLQQLNRSSIQQKISSVEAKNLAKTPIAKSLEKVIDDAKSAQGPVTVILITDGEETCGGDPEAAIKALVDKGLDVHVNIVGFAINEYALKETFATWAAVGRGTYIDAGNADQLMDGVLSATQTPFNVLDAKGEMVAQGLINGPKIELPIGSYSIQPLDETPDSQPKITIEPEKLNVINL